MACFLAIERHRQLALREQRADVLAVERADHVIGAIGHRLLVGGAGAGGGVIEGDGRALAALGVVAGQEAVADRLGGRRQAAGDRQQGLLSGKGAPF